MESLWRASLWKQFGAAIDTFDKALVACPDTLWRETVWLDPSAPTGRAEFWQVAYHALFWLDVYLFGKEEGFTPPAPFALNGPDDDPASLPDQPYTKAELRGYLASLRQQCHDSIETLSDERARQPAGFPWMEDIGPISYAELQVYSMRHVQEHAAQLSLLLGQHGVPGEQLDWVPRAH